MTATLSSTWENQAACRPGASTVPAEWFELHAGLTLPQRGSHRSELIEEMHRRHVAAIRLCRRCPVTALCAQRRDADSSEGVWGGELYDDRRRRVNRCRGCDRPYKAATDVNRCPTCRNARPHRTVAPRPAACGCGQPLPPRRQRYCGPVCAAAAERTRRSRRAPTTVEVA